MPRARRLLAAAAALIVLAPAASAGGAAESAVPANAVARVGDDLITRATFEHWLKIVVNEGRDGPRIVYRPPDFVSCVKVKRKTRQGTREQLKTQCMFEYEERSETVLQFLIIERWVAGEAAARGVALSPRELDTAYREAKHDLYPKESDFRRYLRRSGLTVADFRFRVAFTALHTKLRRLAIDAAPAVTDADVAAYYDTNKDRFVEPETRDLLVVVTKTRAQANAARAALEHGRTWRQVARQYSIDEASARDGGRLVRVGNELGSVMNRAVLRAPVGKLRGPVKTRLGYYVFQVSKITPARQQTLAEAAPAMRDELIEERELAADDAFERDLRARWRALTTCRTDYLVLECGNAPFPATDAALGPAARRLARAR